MTTHHDYLLSPDEVERFDATFSGNSGIKEMLEDSAAEWRGQIRARCQSPAACRREFLRNMIVRNGTSVPEGVRMDDLPSLARYLCLRVEQRVEELDRAEQSGKNALTNAPVGTDPQRKPLMTDPIDFYATLLSLDQGEREELQALTLNDDFLEKVVGDYAMVWRRRQKAATPTTLLRRGMLLRAAFVALKFSFSCETASNRVEIAFALWLCDRIEHRADELMKTEPPTTGTSGWEDA